MEEVPRHFAVCWCVLVCPSAVMSIVVSCVTRLHRKHKMRILAEETRDVNFGHTASETCDGLSISHTVCFVSEHAERKPIEGQHTANRGTQQNDDHELGDPCVDRRNKQVARAQAPTKSERSEERRVFVEVGC